MDYNRRFLTAATDSLLDTDSEQAAQVFLTLDDVPDFLDLDLSAVEEFFHPLTDILNEFCDTGEFLRNSFGGAVLLR